MRILWVATKAPWPLVDGGRLLLANTLRALAEAGHELTLVAPSAGAAAVREGIEAELSRWCRPVLVPARPRSSLAAALRAQWQRTPWTIVRHALPAMRQRVAELVRDEIFDLVQVEQVQAICSAESALDRGRNVVLRAQNVESDLWSQSAARGSWRRPALALEARRLAAWEGRAVRRCAATLALTAEDASRLAILSGAGERIHHVPAPFESELPAAAVTLPGSPPVVLFGSAGWRPNAAGAVWFLHQVWPRVRASLPDAALHLFGLRISAPGVIGHPAPADSREAYPRGAVMVVPLGVASGVRIKILEAWARGVPVVATLEAARGLEAEDGEQLLLARGGEEFANALARIHREAGLAARLVANGRRHLQGRHDLPRVAQRLEKVYASLALRRRR